MYFAHSFNTSAFLWALKTQGRKHDLLEVEEYSGFVKKITHESLLNYSI